MAFSVLETGCAAVGPLVTVSELEAMGIAVSETDCFAKVLATVTAVSETDCFAGG